MSTTSTPIAPEVRLFLAKVRAELADIDPDELAEITDGLEADLGELVAERGPSSLGDPVEYAGELRLAAGIPARGGSSSTRPAVAEGVTALLDRSAAGFHHLVSRLPVDITPVLEWLRPGWWIVRGWVAAQVSAALMAHVFGSGGYRLSTVELIPYLRGYGWLVVAVSVVMSVAIGSRRWWPGTSTSILARLVIVVMNATAVVGLALIINGAQGSKPGPVTSAEAAAYQSGYQDGTREAETPPYYASEAGIYSGGHWVSQIFPYDASGKPLVGVQLFDQRGKPISVVTQPECGQGTGQGAVVASESVDDPLGQGECREEETEVLRQSRIYYPWTNGAAQLYNVFPLTSRFQDGLSLQATAFAGAGAPTVGALPFATVPPISLPGVPTTATAQVKAEKKETKK